MTKQSVFDYFGGSRNTAEALGVTTQAVYRWPEDLTALLERRVIAYLIKNTSLKETKKAFPASFISE